jgi:hypothetical protein
VRSRNRRNVSRIRFGSNGLTDVAVLDTDKLPVEVRGGYTGRLYVWRDDRPCWPVWVDVRDLPTVIKRLEDEHGIGIDDLAGKLVDVRKADLKAKAKPSKSRSKSKDSSQTEAEQEKPPEPENEKVTEV